MLGTRDSKIVIAGANLDIEFRRARPEKSRTL